MFALLETGRPWERKAALAGSVAALVGGAGAIAGTLWIPSQLWRCGRIYSWVRDQSAALLDWENRHPDTLLNDCHRQIQSPMSRPFPYRLRMTPQRQRALMYSLQSNHCLINETHVSASDSPALMPQDPISDLVSALQPVRRAWVQAANKTLAEVGLPTALGAIVVVTARMGERVQQKVLAAEVGVNPAALVRTLDQGEAAGLLVREGIEGDRRGKSVSLSPQGRILAVRMEEMLADLRDHLLGDVPVADILTATRVLRMLGDRATGHAVALQDDAGHAAA